MLEIQENIFQNPFSLSIRRINYELNASDAWYRLNTNLIISISGYNEEAAEVSQVHQHDEASERMTS